MSRPNVSVSAVAASRSMCLLADAKDELGIAAADTSSDAKLNRVIRRASAFLAGPLGIDREPWLQTYLESRPGDGGVYLPLSNYPAKGEATSVTQGTGASPSTVDSTTYSVAGRARDRLYRAGGWSLTEREPPGMIPNNGDRDLVYNVTYPAGWVMPDQYTDSNGTVTAWQASTAYAAGVWLRDDSDLDYPLIFEVTTAGTSDSSEPTWSSATADGDTITDNGVTWTAREQRLPEDLEEAALMLALDLYAGGWKMPSGIKREAADGVMREYMETRGMSAAIERIAGSYR